MKELIKKIAPPSFLKWYHVFQTRSKINHYDGDAVWCSICNSKFKEFASTGLVLRKNARCHNCGSLERDRLLWKYLNEMTDLFCENRKLRLLHFAPEKVFYDILSDNKSIEYYPCDLEPQLYQGEGKTEVKQADITDIPYEDNYFDVVLCNHVLEHIPDDKKAMSELFRVMKGNAWAILQVPIDYSKETTYEDFLINTPDAREKAFGQGDHVRWYGKDYKKRLAKVGFKVKEDHFIDSFSKEELFRYGLMESEVIYYCEKQA